MDTEFYGPTIGLSIIVPVLNEQESLSELHRQLTDVLAGLDLAYEILFVDDGSVDGSTQLCAELTMSDPHVVLVEMRRNFGKAAALEAGFRMVRGDVVITMDADLQDDPREIVRFLETLNQGFDLVSGWKKDRNDPLTKKLPSRVFNMVTSSLTGIALKDCNSGFKAYRREVIENINVYGELHRYIPVLAHAKGFRVGEIAVRHHPRRFGNSKYSFERFFRGAFDLLTILFLRSFQRRPLHLFGLIGSIFFLTGFVIDSYLTVLWLNGSYIGSRPLLVLGTLLIIVGLQVLAFGLLAELITASTYRRSDVTELIRRVERGQAMVTVSPKDNVVSQKYAGKESRLS